MAAHRQVLEACPVCGDGAPTDNFPTGKKIIKDDKKSKEQLIEELLELRQRVAELEDAQTKLIANGPRDPDLVEALSEGLEHVKTLKGLLPICTSCKKIRDDQGYWNHLELYIRDHSEADFTHGLCPECVKRLYPVDILTSDNSVSRTDP
jgi:hypothetical protein